MKKISLVFSLFGLTTLFGTTLNENLLDNSLIIYNSNVALVHESRELKMKKSDSSIIYKGVASSINTDSVNVNLPDEVSLFSQQYRFDKLTQKKLLDAHIGKEVEVKVKSDTKKFQILKVTLLSNDFPSCIVKNGSDIFSVDSKNIIFKSIPKELITKPSLVWNVSVSKDIQKEMSIDYLINSISWKSNYILNLDGDRGDLSGWITIDNRSGKAFKGTKLHLLAGDINRAREPRQEYRVMKTMAVANDTPVASHQAYEGYHLYTIPFDVSLVNNEKTSLKFITQKGIKLERRYTTRMSNPYYFRGETKHDVTQSIALNGFKYPLPKGVVRTYSKLGDTNILLGESLIKHTPKDTPLLLTLGKNFDVKVKEMILNRDDRKYQLKVDVKYSIKNSSNNSKTIEVLVPFNKNKGSKVKSDEKFTYTRGNIISFKIKIDAEDTKEFKVHYTIQKN